MAKWPTTPTWHEPTEINGGEMFNAPDGVTDDDFNAIIENLLYLERLGGSFIETWDGTGIIVQPITS